MARRRLASFHLWLGATFVALVVAAVAAPNDPYIRWQSLDGTLFERAKRFYERIHFDPTPIDVAFIGSSRTASALETPELEAALAARGAPMRVANFSLPASGYDIRYVIARELLETRDVKLLVISVVEQFPRDGHQAFGEIARAGDVLAAPWIVNRTLPENLARLPVRQLQFWLESLVPDAFGRSAGFDPAAYPGASAWNRPPDADYWTAEDPQALAEEAARRRREITPPLLPDWLGGVEFGVTRHYIDAIADLAEAHGVALAFVFFPFYEGFEDVRERDFLERLGPLWAATPLMRDPANYRDAAHVSGAGRVRAAAWMAERLSAAMDAGLFAPPPSPPPSSEESHND
ncbi:hypothetical protein [Rubrimonas cliftonensis]|uniref:Uncharacterized protein n=1 Tax=Rubrimonas cliftonensis TaxID=89524 RepID=A0A1H4CVL2_9RHOB|nr:hypothetical protein [Rubrimonas cliftonensis]SEA64431.1 hypothetical protein SAMN05444370_10861 [Rubrimonas cliftonensis]